MVRETVTVKGAEKRTRGTQQTVKKIKRSLRKTERQRWDEKV